MARKKTVLKSFDYRHCDSFAAYLGDMAKKGWHFKQWGAGLVFEQGEPEDAVYAVEIFSEGSEYDTRPEPKTQEFGEYCEAAGWKLIDAKRKFCIFKRTRPDALPILTDEERLDNIFKSYRKDVWYRLILAAVWVFTQASQFSMNFGVRIFSTGSLLIAGLWCILFIMAAFNCAQLYIWRHRSRKQIAAGEKLKLEKKPSSNWYSNLYLFFYLGFLVMLILTGGTTEVIFILIFLSLMTLMAFLIAKFRPDAVTNQVIQVVASIILVFGFMGFSIVSMLTDSEDEIVEPPLTYSDFGLDYGSYEVNYSDYIENRLGSHAHSNLSYLGDDSGREYLYYDIYRSEHTWILDKLWEEETYGKVNEIRTDCTESWGAVLAFRNNAGDYLVRYEDAILVLCLSHEEELTQAQIAAVLSTLDLAGDR